MIEGYGNDIVLIKFFCLVMFNIRVGLVCMLSGKEMDRVVFGKMCYIMGK